MKLKILMISMLLSNVASANNSNYIFNIQNKSYVNAIQVVDETNQEEPNNPTINPVCGTANGVDIDEKPTTNLCEKGTASSVITTNGVHNWTCQSESETTSCNANQIINTAKHSSCKNMLQEYPQLLGQDGVYAATVGGLSSKLYCNMTDQGGGWTLILAQFEGDRAGWDEGIQSDYDPSLATNKAFTLSSTQIPQHTQISFSHSNYENKRVTNVFNYVYNSSISISPRILITDILNGDTYYIHRSPTSYYAAHNPEGTGVSYSSSDEWRNTLTIDKNGGAFYSFAFSFYALTNAGKGYAYKGYKSDQNDTGAWLIYVR